MPSEYITSPLLADTSTTAREDYLGLITMVDPVSFPLMRLLPHRKCNNTLHSWLMDNIPYDEGIQASPEGQQASGLRSGTAAVLGEEFDSYPGITGAAIGSFTTTEDRYRRQRAANVTHILNKLVSISGTQQVSDEAGIGDEYNYQVYRMGTALLQQQEYNLHWSNYVDGASGNEYARKMHGLIPWILSTGLDNSNPTIAGLAVNNYYSATVAYNPTWYPFEAATGGTDTIAPRATVTGPFRAYWNGSAMASFSAGEVVPRLFMSGGAGSFAVLDNLYFTDASVTTADLVLDLNHATNFTDGDDVTGDFSVDLTRTLLHKYILQPAYQKGMKIGGSIMLCSSAIKRLVGDFAHVYGSGSSNGSQVNYRTIPASDRKLYDSIDYYETQFGVIGVHQDRYMESSTPYNPAGGVLGFHSTAYTNSETYYVTPSKSFVIIEPDMAEIAPFKDRGFFHADLGKQGDSLEGMLTSELSFRMLNPRAFAGGFGFSATEGTLTT